MKVKVGISNHHVHLDEETYKYLFGDKPLEVRNYLNQKGEFASTATVDLKYEDKTIEHVRVVGPLRKKTQIELLKKDLEYFNLDAPTRRSGDLENTPSITLVVGDKSITTDGVIRAERHVHVSKDEEEKLGLHERDKVKLKTATAEFEAYVKVSDNGFFELHIDKDEAEEYGLDSNEEIELISLR